MKSNLKNIKTKPFPKLMQIGTDSPNNGAVVLFKHNGIGTVVHGAGKHRLGDDSEDWYMGGFKDFDGTVELSND